MVNILMFGMSSYPGGIESYIVNTFCNERVSAEAHIDFVTYESKLAYEDEIRKCGYNIIFAPHLKKNPVGYWKCIKQAIEANAYDCVYVNMLTAANALPVALASLFGVKSIILHAHANSTTQGFSRRFLHNLNKGYCQKKSTLKLACSEAAGKWLFEEHPFEIIPNAIDCEKFSYNETVRNEIRNQLGIKQNQIVIGHIGRIAEEKNHLFMLQILKEILRTDPTAKMVFVGDGYLVDAVKNRVEDLELKDSVVFYGNVLFR